MRKHDTSGSPQACQGGEDIVAYLRNELDPQEQQVVQKHLAECDVCRAEADGFRGVVAALESDKETSGSRDMVPMVMARLSDESDEKAGLTGSLIQYRWLRIAACLLAAVGIGYVIHSVLDQFPVSDPGRTSIPTPVMSSEQAQEGGLTWLVKVQDKSGKWDPDKWGGRREYTVGLTGMALLSLVRTQSDFEGKGQSSRMAVDYLLAQQSDAGRFGDKFDGTMYNHGIATVALIEAFGRTKNTELLNPIRSALGFIRDQQLRSGGWGYIKAVDENANTAISAWPLQALLLAQRAGWEDEGHALKRGLRWLVGVVDDRGQFGYSQPEQFPQGPETLTAMGAYCILLAVREGVDINPRVKLKVDRALSVNSAQHKDFYRTYFQICAFSEANAGKWADSMVQLQEDLVNNREIAGQHEGSWTPLDQWGQVGGRVYSTALSALSLGAAPFEDS